MLISESSNREEILSLVEKELREIGIKLRYDKQRPGENKRRSKKIFKVPLNHLELSNGILSNGSVCKIPKFVLSACQIIQKNCKCEGIFRKTGSIKSQRQIQELLEKGGSLDKNFNAIDVANLLKTFFRELPEPLIPLHIQDALIRCLISCSSYEAKTDAILKTCLFLQPLQVNTLAYFLQFLEVITKNSQENLMNKENLIKVLTPSIMPLPINGTERRLHSHFKVIELLIENANLIGIVSDHVRENIPAAMVEERKKKKRRSGSLNRVFNGFRKIVGAIGSSENLDDTIDNDFTLATPNATKSARKRRLDRLDVTYFSSKKKKDLQLNLTALPETDDTLSSSLIEQEHREQKSTRKSILENATAEKKSPKLRRWSFAPGNTTNRNEKISVVAKEEEAQRNEKPYDELNGKSEEYIRVPLKEYEAFKCRLNSIETKICREFNAAKLDSLKAEMRHDNSFLNGPEKVEHKFNETLHEVEKLEDSDKKTEQLAKRLSRDLKIRPNAENAIIRSPSARKIGSLRRRRDSSATNLSRTRSWHIGSNSNVAVTCNDDNATNGFTSTLNFYPKPNLKRSRPLNIPHDPKIVMKDSSTSLTPSAAKVEKIVPEKPLRKSTLPNNEVWIAATDFFNDKKNEQDDVMFKTPVRVKKFTAIKSEKDTAEASMRDPSNTPFSKRNTLVRDRYTPQFNKSLLLTPSDTREARASIVQIRNQNAGMVAQKARLFDDMLSDLTRSVEKPVKIPRVPVNKNFENVKSMSLEDRTQKAQSPRRASKSPGGINRRLNLRNANQSPALKTIKEKCENPKTKAILLQTEASVPRKSYRITEALREIASPRKRQQNDNRKFHTPQSASRRHSRTPTNSARKGHTPRQNVIKSPRLRHKITARRHNISFD